MTEGSGTLEVVEEAKAKEVDDNATTLGKCSADKVCTQKENNKAREV